MRIVMLGASGATGRLAVEQAAAAGHEVIAVARRGATLGPEPSRVVEGDVRDPAVLTDALSGSDVVISALGIGRARTPDGLMSAVSDALISAAGRTDVRRLVLLSAFGVGQSLQKASPLLRLLYRGGQATFADKAVGEDTIRRADIAWTFVYPGLLTNKAATGQIRARDLADIDRVPGVPRIPRADVAAFLLAAAADPAWVHKTAVVTVGATS